MNFVEYIAESLDQILWQTKHCHTDPERAFRNQGFRRGLAAKSIRLDIDPGDASRKTGKVGKTPDTIKKGINTCGLEELRTVSQFKKSLMSALLLTTTCIEFEDSLRGSCCCERHRQTSRSVCENPDLASCSVEVVDGAAKQRLRVKEESYKAYIEEELSLRKRHKEIHQV